MLSAISHCKLALTLENPMLGIYANPVIQEFKTWAAKTLLALAGLSLTPRL